MKRRLLAKYVLPLVIAVAAAGCSSDSSAPQAGAGGSGSGGAGSGGKTGSGGSGFGGTTTGSGGTGLGGSTGTGGSTTVSGTGGGAGRGGNTGTGGSAGVGGSTLVGTGGIPAGGATSTGGGVGGSSTDTGGVVGAGGGAGSGGSGPASGGRSGSDAGTNSTGGGGGTSIGTGGTRADGGPDGPADSGGGTGGGGGYNPCPTTAGTACVILPLGDSITEGYGATGNVGGYRIELFRQTVTDGKNITFVGSLTNGPTTVANKTFPRKHEGHGGYTIDSGTGHSGISGSITDSAMSSYKPHIVLLMIGTNDINGNIDTANAPTRLTNLVDEITKASPSTLLVVASIIPSQNDGTNRNFQTYNNAIPGVVSKAAAAGKHVVFLDNWAAFSADSSYKTKLMTDNLHPNDAGYVVLGQSWYKAIGAFLPAAQ